MELAIKHDVDLRQHSTMRLGGKAAHAVDVHTPEELRAASLWAKKRNLPAIVIGGGSNIIWKDEGFSGLLIINKLLGFQDHLDGDVYTVTMAAGENWDECVARTVKKGITGIECLSLIPGTAGATPVQNVGAYYQDIGTVFVSLEAYDSQTDQFVTLYKPDCKFAYRTSRFKKGPDRGRFLITSITLQLRKANPEAPFYPSVQSILDAQGITEYTPQVLRDVICDVRRSKLPDPTKVANNGSFFANPFVTQQDLDRIQAAYGPVLHWPTDDGRMKMPAAWLIDKAGFRNHHDPKTGMGTWPEQALVLVNESATRSTQLEAYRDIIINAVRDKFGITLEPEPELLPL